MSSQIRVFSCVVPHNADVTLFTSGLVNREKLVDVIVYLVNRPISLHSPTRSGISNMRDVFMCALMMRLVNASNLMLCHVSFRSTVTDASVCFVVTEVSNQFSV
jgi:hypothetical protein